MDDATQTTVSGLLSAVTDVNEVIVGIAAAWAVLKVWKLIVNAMYGKGS